MQAGAEDLAAVATGRGDFLFQGVGDVDALGTGSGANVASVITSGVAFKDLSETEL